MARNSSRSETKTAVQQYQAVTQALSPAAALAKYAHVLTDYEQKELTDNAFTHVYFVGDAAKKLVCTTDAALNYGFDDDEDALVLVQNDHIAYRYEVIQTRPLGKGTFSRVVKAKDHKTNAIVAIKIILNQKDPQKNLFYNKLAHREAWFLRLLLQQDTRNTIGVVHMIESFMFRQHKCLVFEMLSQNLYELCRMNNFKGFKLNVVAKFAQGLLKCLYTLHVNHIVHADLKPENVMLRRPNRTSLKVIDFGYATYNCQPIGGHYFQSRFYRAPEVLLGGAFSCAVDMWSFGCIIAELYIGHPLFPGRDADDQLASNMELLGLPPASFLRNCNNVRRAFRILNDQLYLPRYCPMLQKDDDTVWLKGNEVRGAPGSICIERALNGCVDEYFKDFLLRCLAWDPHTRMTAPEALSHIWIRQMQHSCPRSQKNSNVENAPGKCYS